MQSMKIRRDKYQKKKEKLSTTLKDENLTFK